MKTDEIITLADYPTKSRWKIVIATVAALGLIAWMIHWKIGSEDQWLLWPAYLITCAFAYWRIRSRRQNKTPHR